jgi:hypothetical protein
VEKYFDLRLTGPVKHGVLFKVNCSAQNPSAEMRGGFFELGLRSTETPSFPMRNCASGNVEPRFDRTLQKVAAAAFRQPLRN